MHKLLSQAIAAHRAGDLAAAEKLYRAIINDDPRDADALDLLGVLKGAQGDHASAEDLIAHAISLDPNAALFRVHLSDIFLRCGRFAEALREAQRAAELAPDNVDCWVVLCDAAEKSGDYGEVLRGGEQLARLVPGRPQAHFIRGLALGRLGHIGESEVAYRQVLALDPGYADAWINLGEIYQSQNRLEEAEDAYIRAIEANGEKIADEERREVAEEEYGGQHWNLALVELLRGDLLKGFAHYRARFKALPHHKRPDFSASLWRGEDVRGKTILVTVEQGYGDTLMLCRYLPLLKARGARVLFQIPTALVPLFRDWDGADQILEWRCAPSPAFDFHASVFDLPHRFGTTLTTLPAHVPYLPMPASDKTTRLAEDGRLKVGVVWGGNPAQAHDTRRSVPLADFAPLFETKDAQFFNLTRDLRPGDAEILARYPVVDLAPRLTDFAVTAHLMGGLDLVISCDTATAHLAGGLGKPLWVPLAFVPAWHWMLERDDSPWYPTARLFRQKRLGDWANVIRRMQEALEEKARS
jgi:tetratricopeptide (TPR) repeat protein